MIPLEKDEVVVVVCTAIIIAPMAMSVSVISKAKSEELRAVSLWTTCWRGMHPLWFLAYRSMAVTVLGWLFYELVLMEGTFSFYFYTQWTLMLVIFYFMIATLITANGCWVQSKQAAAISTGRLIENKQNYLDQEEAGFWGYVMQIAYQTSAGASVLTDIVFWFVLVPSLSPGEFTINLVMGLVHSLNIIFLVIDTMLNNQPFGWFRMAYFVLWSGIYVTFLWILNACGSSWWWPYPFLELRAPWAPLWYLSMALVHFPCYGVYILIVKAKSSYFPRLFPKVYRGSH